MRLFRVRVTGFKSSQDSGEFAASDVTWLVGNNESAKTALEAVYHLNPITESEAVFEVTV